MDNLDYLNPGFDPRTLKVIELRKVLNTHKIPVTSAAKKQVLVDLFNEHIVPNAGVLRIQAESNITPTTPTTVHRQLAPRLSPQSSEPRLQLESPAASRTIPVKIAPKIDPEVTGDSAAEAKEEETKTPKRPVARRGGRTKRPAGRQESILSSDDDGVVVTTTPRPRGRPRGRPPKSASSKAVKEGEQSEADVATPLPKAPSTEGEPSSKDKEQEADSALVSPPPRPGKRRIGRPRKSLVATPAQPAVDPASPESDIEMAQEAARVKQRAIADATAQAIGSRAATEPDRSRRVTLSEILSDTEGGIEHGQDGQRRATFGGSFSHYNPFQSGGEESPKDLAPKKTRRPRVQGESSRRASSRSTTETTPQGAKQEMDSDEEDNITVDAANSPFYSPFSTFMGTPAASTVAGTLSEMEDSAGEQDPVRSTGIRQRLYAKFKSDEGKKREREPISSRRSSTTSIASPPVTRTAASRVAVERASTARHPVLVTFIVIALLMVAGNLVWFRHQKRLLGYCDTNVLPTDPHQNVLSMLQEPQCTPCPLHATCTDHALVGCESGFLLREHPLASIWPFSATCVADSERERRVEFIIDAAITRLAEHTGFMQCGYTHAPYTGLTLQDLHLRLEERLKGTMSQEHLVDAWSDADRQLIEHASEFGITLQRGPVEGESTLVSNYPVYPLGCRIQLALRSLFMTYLYEVLATLAIVSLISYSMFRYRRYKEECTMAEQLFNQVIELLANQERAHFANPSQTPHAAISVTHARDTLLWSINDVARRDRIWLRVQRRVERNSNVRARIMELRGEQTRAWEWVGTVLSTRPPPVNTMPECREVGRA